MMALGRYMVIDMLYPCDHASIEGEEPDLGEFCVDVIVTSECIHPYFLCIVTQCLFWEVYIKRSSLSFLAWSDW